MGNLLFSPSGRIGRQEFIKGAVVLLAINFFLWLAWFISMGIGVFAAFGSLALIWCWACLFIKRFADAGKSGGFFALVFIGFVIVSYILANMLTIILSPDMLEVALDLQELTQEAQPDMEALMPAMAKMMKGIVIPYAASYFLTGAAFAFGINALLAPKA